MSLLGTPMDKMWDEGIFWRFELFGVAFWGLLILYNITMGRDPMRWYTIDDWA